jgi:hypothetical protein
METQREAKRMRQSAAISGRIAIWMAVAGACVTASVIAAWPSGEDTSAPPVEVVDARFLDGIAVLTGAAALPTSEDPVVSPGAVVDARFPAKDASRPCPLRAGAGETDELQRGLFSPRPSNPQTAAQPAGPTRAEAAVVVEATAAAATAVANNPVVAAADRHAGSVLNDAQIASIKERLSLTPDQQRMWPAVEVALRKLAYAKRDQGLRRSGARRGGHARNLAAIDPGSDDIKHLKSAAVPLIMSFSGDQERQLRALAQIAGLDKLIPGRNPDHAF